MSRRGENIYFRKDGRWEGRYIKGRKLNGKPIFGSIYGKKYADVKRELVVKKSEYSKPNSVVLIYKSGTLGDWANYWLEVMIAPNVADSTLGQYRRIINNHIIPHLGEIALRDISPEHIEAMINFLKRNFACSTTASVCGILSAIIKSAIKKKLIVNDPFEEISKPKYKVRSPRVLTIKEQHKIERDAIKNGEIEYLLCLYTGIRVGELCALRWSRIDFKANTIIIDSTVKRVASKESKRKTVVMIGKPKTDSSSRMIPVPAFMMEILERKFNGCNAEPDDFVFPNKQGNPLDMRTVQKRFEKITRSLKIKGAHMHTLRHSFVARCLERGIHIVIISELLGHSSPTITLKCYAHCTFEDKRKSISRLKMVA